MTTRSQVLVRYTAADNVWHTGFQPPAGWCWIVKTISISGDANPAGTLQLRIAEQTGPYYCDVIRQELAQDQIIEFQTWVMVMDTDQIAFIGPGANVGFWISGTELPMPPEDQSVTSPL
jgi:hypothetical protein